MKQVLRFPTKHQLRRVEGRKRNFSNMSDVSALSVSGRRHETVSRKCLFQSKCSLKRRSDTAESEEPH